WPGVIVEENNLTQSISALRQALGERPGTNRYVATVPRKGYRFVSAVTELASLAGERPVSTPVAGVAERKPSRHSAWSSAAIAALVVLGGGGAFFVLGTGEHSAAPPVQAHVLGGTEDSTAYLLYANGRYALARSTEPSLVLAIGYFEQAIARDPNFALAHA